MDFDGDGDNSEGIYDEIATLEDALLAAIRDHARNIAGSPIAYDPHAHPYFFHDTDGDGVVSEDEAASANQYRSWTPRLLRSAYNYQYSIKDPGGYAHNPHYVIGLLHDSLENLGAAVAVDTDALVRPEP